MRSEQIVVVGGGPSGIVAAYAAAMKGRSVLLLEKNEKLGKKLYITGKGRCNITNNCDLSVFFTQIIRNPKFLMSALHQYSNMDLQAMLEREGLPLKVERGERVFPVSDRSSDVIQTLSIMLKQAGVNVLFHTNVKTITKQKQSFIVHTDQGDILADQIILATGGKSYPKTGSTGDGWKWAAQLGHRIVAPVPALIPLVDKSGFCKRMQGLALKNVLYSLYQEGELIYSEQGELIFTHFGISGPVVLSSSSMIDYRKENDFYVEIDLKPALDDQKLDRRLLRDFTTYANKTLRNYLPSLLPVKLIDPFLDRLEVDGDIRVHQITKEIREKMIQQIKHFGFEISGTRPLSEAIVTAGGIDVDEVNPSTMESKINPNLFFCGEMLDVSAQTGGYNLQIAFSTGFLAGSNVH